MNSFSQLPDSMAARSAGREVIALLYHAWSFSYICLPEGCKSLLLVMSATKICTVSIPESKVIWNKGTLFQADPSKIPLTTLTSSWNWVFWKWPLSVYLCSSAASPSATSCCSLQGRKGSSVEPNCTIRRQLDLIFSHCQGRLKYPKGHKNYSHGTERFILLFSI